MAGLTVRETRGPVGLGTVMDAVLLVISPVNPLMLAVIEVRPALFPVTKPVGLTLATPAMLEAQVTWLVMSCCEAGWLPWPIVPMAVSWTVAPGPKVTVVGEITIESIEVLLPQPIKGTVRPTKSNALKQKRPDIELSSDDPQA